MTTVPGTSKTDLYDVADTLLAIAVAGLAQSRTGVALPDRTFVGHGPPAVEADCTDLVTVYLDHVEHRPGVQATGLPGGAASCHLVPVAVFWIEWWRCGYPTVDDQGTAPTAEAIDDAAAQNMADLWSLLTYLYAQRVAGNLVVPESCENTAIGIARPLPPSGGTSGYRVMVAIAANSKGP